MILQSPRVHIGTLITIPLLLLAIITRPQGLQIGNKISNFEVKNILNYKSTEARLTDFTDGKALLIDFWTSTCASCIESFLKLDSIQKEFKDDLNILLVTYEPKEKVLKTFKAIKRIGHVKLPSVVSDTLLHLIFPHISAPHEIWIDKKGELKAVTDHTQINRKNIHSLVRGEVLNLPLKKDNFEFSYDLPSISTLNREKTIKYTFFSDYQQGISSSSGFYIDPDNGFLIANNTNVSFQTLYVQAYNQWGNNFNYSRLIIDQDVIERLDKVEHLRNSFCYEKWWRDTSKIKARREMQNELDLLFSVKSYTEKRKMPCIVLKETGIQKRYKSIENPIRTAAYNNGDTLFLDNVELKYPIKNIINYGRHAWSPYQFIDETGHKGRMSVRLPKTFNGITQLNQFLRDVDLKVIVEDRLLDVIVIKEMENKDNLE